MTGTALMRFQSKFTVDLNGCWIWSGSLTSTDRHTGVRRYGQFWINGRTVMAHRWSYEEFVGPIPDGLTIDHLCRVSRCVNPRHLEPVTMLENIRRGPTAQKTHCKHGHPFDNRNTKRYRGTRMCRTCHNHWVNLRKKRLRQQARGG